MSSKQPGVLFEIAGIPTAVVNNHQEAQYYRQLLDIKGATLINFDAHADHISYCPVFTVSDGLSYWEKLACDNHVAAGLHTGNLSEYFWLNPHTGIIAELRRPSLEIKGKNMVWKDRKTSWIPNRPPANWVYVPCAGNQVHEFDLDGFCTNEFKTKVDLWLDGVRESSVENWDERMDWAIAMTKHASRPNLITIVRSQGKPSFFRKERVAYVPKNKVNEVQNHLLERLTDYYAK